MIEIALEDRAPRRIAVVGAGMAGMAAAYELARLPGVAVTVFEASDRLGGTVETITVPSATGKGAFVIETGPDSWVSDKPSARALAIELGLGDELMGSNDAQRRNYLARGRTLEPMPDGMRMMVPTRWAPVLESPLFSWQARLAYLREPKRAAELKAEAIARIEADPDADESVGSFVRRHFGHEATETIAGPLLAGVFGGDIETLSAGAVLAPFVRMEREHGSLVNAVMERARSQAVEGASQTIFTTLRCGLQALIDRMAARLHEGSVQLRTPVASVQRQGDAWALTTRATHGAGEQVFDGVVLATPPHVTCELLACLDADAAALLLMETTSAIVVALAYEGAAAERLRIPRGFGFLVPPGAALSEEPTLLAGTFMHQKFTHRAPPGAVFLRGFFGGLAAPRMMDWDDAAIAEAARAHFARLVGPLPLASHIVVRRWPRSLPQYAVGHSVRMRMLDARIALMPGLRLAGNAYEGVGLPNLIDQGKRIAQSFVQMHTHVQLLAKQ